MAEGAVFQLLSNFTSYLGEEVNLLTGLREDIDYIRSEFQRMTHFLRVADAVEDRYPELKVWVKQVRDAAFDTADALDLYMLRLGHHHGAGFCGLLHKVSCFINTLKARHQIASDVKGIKARIVNISEGHRRYSDTYGRMEQGSSSTHSHIKWYDCRGDALLLQEADLVGIDGPKSQLIQWLVDEDPQLKVLSIAGMGGLGKTTIAKKVYDNARVTRHFEIHAWITVSEAFKDEELLKVMIRQLFEEARQPLLRGVENIDINGLKRIIYDFLLQKRKTFQGNSCPSYLEDVSRKILRRCEGLPLAIVAVSGLLSTKENSRDEWDMISRSFGAELEGNDKLMSLNKILSLSYFDLPRYLKLCFLYLSIFPEDCFIDHFTLIRLWVAEGFVEEKEGMTKEEVAEGYITELVSRSLVQVAVMRMDGRVKFFRIHDFWREIVISKSTEQNIVSKASAEKVRRLSLHHNFEDIQSNCFTRLRSLLVFSVEDPLPILSKILSLGNGVRLLTVLDLRDTQLETFPNEIVKLLHLTYLCLRGTKVKMIPKSIGNLKKLETLDLKRTNVIELPNEILKLQHLRHLLLYSYKRDTYFKFSNITGFKAPNRIGSMSSLQKLCAIEANHGNNNIMLRELGKLTQLRRLNITKLPTEYGKELCSSLEKLINLHSLKVRATEEDEILDLDSLSLAPQQLRTLYLEGFLKKIPHWIPSLHNLKRLCFWWSKLRDVDPLQSFQDLPNLVELSLWSAYGGDGLCFKAGGFQKLKKLWLLNLEGLRWVRMEASSMPLLDFLYLGNCNLMTKLPSGVEYLANLEVLELVDMSDTLISSLNKDLQGGDYSKIAHIPKVWISDSKFGFFKGRYL